MTPLRICIFNIAQTPTAAFSRADTLRLPLHGECLPAHSRQDNWKAALL